MYIKIAVSLSFLSAAIFASFSTETLTGLWSSIRFLLVPPYLFITVHFIIVAIWKLSDHNKTLLTNSTNPAKDNEEEAEARNEAKPLKTTDESDAKSDDSCVTTEEVEKSEELVGVEEAWEKMVKRSATWTRSSEAAEVAAEIEGEKVVRRSVSFGNDESPENDEWNQKFEAFIKKNYDQIRSY